MAIFDLDNPSAYTRRSFLSHGLVLASAATTVPYFVQALRRRPHAPARPLQHARNARGPRPGRHPARRRQRRPQHRHPLPRCRVLQGPTRHRHPREQSPQARQGRERRPAPAAHGPQRPLRRRHAHRRPRRRLPQSQSLPLQEHGDLADRRHQPPPRNGWLGRYFDNDCCGFDSSGKATPEPMAGIAVGKEAPLAMQGQIAKPIGFESSELFQWLGKGVDPKLMPAYDQISNHGVSDGTDPSSNAGFLMRTAMDAQVASDQIRKAVAQALRSSRVSQQRSCPPASRWSRA